MTSFKLTWDVVLFAVVMTFLIGVQIINKTNATVDKQVNGTNSKLLTVTKVSQVCIEEPSSIMVCQDINDTQYNILLVKDDVDGSHHLIIKYQRGN
jgi:hypothetical protein